MSHTILLIEDNRLNMELASDVLQAGGYTVLEAMTGDEGIRVAAERLPDLVLLDMRLPDLDGLEVLRRLRSELRTAHVPVVALTAHAMKGDEAAARRAGCAGYITKPINTRTFLAEVGQYLTREERKSGHLQP